MTVKPEQVQTYSISRKLKEFRESAGRLLLKHSRSSLKNISVAGSMSGSSSAHSVSVAGAGEHGSSGAGSNRSVSGNAGAALEVQNASTSSRQASQGRPEERRNPIIPFNVEEIEFHNLEVILTLGAGAFGRVDLVRDVISGAVFALKQISKIKATQKEKHLRYLFGEKHALMELSDRFNVKLYKTFNLQDRCCFLLEPVLGGELFIHMRRQGVLAEDTARFYAASVVLAFEEFHSKGLIYRDLKPENLVLREDGQLVVVDFGYCKKIGPRQRSKSVIGTPEYLPPEVCALEGHSKGYDLWTLGVLLYEMLAKVTPFYKKDKPAMYELIKAVDYHFPRGFPPQAADLVDRLLRRQDFCRLGDRSTMDIRRHPWFAGFDWDALQNRTMKPPITPRLLNHTHGIYYEHKFKSASTMQFPDYPHGQAMFTGF